jgi:hypothetical protein
MLLRFLEVKLYEARKTYQEVVRAPDSGLFAICQKSAI